MFTRKTLPVWLAVMLISGLFLTGQETWAPTCVDTDGDGSGKRESLTRSVRPGDSRRSHECCSA